ncbi:MAG: zinc ABC transporter substrate-binding protein [Desulfobulbaceae bacterium]|nr:zinc ABC transporter substrate-binding protein [Desulfobulbaceae bacterium]
MKKTKLLSLITFLCFSLAAGPTLAEQCKLNVGITLHPYYSWVSNIVGDTATVTTLIPENSDPHSYQPKADDLANLQKIDALVVNGQGHDEYVRSMLKAVDRKDLKVIDTSVGLPLIPTFGHNYNFEKGDDAASKVSYNSHTYIAITGAIQQIQLIANQLGELCPENAILYKKNARAYAKRLRRILLAALNKIESYDTVELRIATVHDGYAYLMQELGLEIAAVIQPRHGIEPNPRQLQDTIKRIKKAKVNILFTEIDYEKRYVNIIFQETGCRIYSLSHISNGIYSADKFEVDIQRNIDDIIKALQDANAKS